MIDRINLNQARLARHVNAGIKLAKWGAVAFLSAAGLVVALVSVTTRLGGGEIPQEAIGQVGGVFFWMLLAVIGMFLVLGFLGSLLVTFALTEEQ